MRFYHLRSSSSDKEWPVGWMQSDPLPCEVVSLVIGIGQGLLARWQGLTFGISSVFARVYWIDDEGLTLASHCYTRVVARGLEVLASYAGWLNLMVITSGMVLQWLRARRVALCNNVTFGVEVMWQLPTTASPHPVWLPSWRSVPPHLRHWVGGARFLLIYATE